VVVREPARLTSSLKSIVAPPVDDTKESAKTTPTASTLPNEPVDVDEPLTSVIVPSLNSAISDAILDDVDVNEPLSVVLSKVLITVALAPNEPEIVAAVSVLINEALSPSEPLISVAI